MLRRLWAGASRQVAPDHENIGDADAKEILVQLLPVPVVADQVNDWQHR